MKFIPLVFALVVFACSTGSSGNLIGQLRRHPGIRLDAERYCIFTYNPNDCAVCVTGFNEAYRELMRNFPNSVQAVVVLPGLREIERRDVLRRAVFSSDSVSNRIIFDDGLYNGFNQQAENNTSNSAILMFSKNGEKLIAVAAHDQIDIQSILKSASK